MPGKSKTKNVLLGVVVAAAVAVIGYIVYTEVVAPKQVVAPAVEMEMPSTTMVSETTTETNNNMNNTQEAALEDNFVSQPAMEAFTNPPASQANTSAMPGSITTASDLLPGSGDDPHAQVNPNGQGDILGSSLLTAGYHTGINTVGTSLRNANRQLRSEPANPQVKVSPWNQTTIDPDMNKRNFEIGN